MNDYVNIILSHFDFSLFSVFFFFNDTATTEIYTLSLHDALPSCSGPESPPPPVRSPRPPAASGMATSRWRSSRSEEHTSELQSHHDLVCRLLLEKKKKKTLTPIPKTKKKK